MEEKVVGGDEVRFGEIDYIASLRHNEGHFCTGFVIDPQHVVTAAQCLKDFLVKPKIPNFYEYTVVVGNPDLFNGTTVSIEQVEVDCRYDPHNPKSLYNYGLIKVNHQYIIKIL